MQTITVLGATGSIGESTLNLIEQHPESFRVFGLSANQDVEGLLACAERCHPRVLAMASPRAAAVLRDRLREHSDPWLRGLEVLEGEHGLCALAGGEGPQKVVAGIVGIAGLRSVWAAVSRGQTVLLANKEALVCAGGLMAAQSQQHGAHMLPVDSEHNAIFQCLGAEYTCFERPAHVRRLLLTASGGPFRTWVAEDIRRATPEQAVKHPNWSMGQKISVDSASLMNKGLELIEAHWLFSLPSTQIDVVVHPQSVIHSMVEFEDGSTLAQLGSPDMRTPIGHAMAWPARMSTQVKSLDWTQLTQLDFECPDLDRFPALRLARACLEAGLAATNVLNAANEACVAAFLARELSFGAMVETIEETVSHLAPRLSNPTQLEDVFMIDQSARALASERIRKRATKG
ncbi:MAG: 1-deoxy-D-xylulose 5-phosphate reductoisomerase [Pseudomonadota bacterium]